MKNYHTHTYRCHHAIGFERDYIEQAIDQGFTTLGFSDHAPWHYDSSFKPFMRMQETEIEDYVLTLRKLREEYQNRIDIKIGFEAEYFEDKMAWMKEMIKRYDIDYLILGNHYDGSDEDGSYYGMPPQTLESVTRYCDQVIKGMETGLFSYVAHPDVIYYDQHDQRHLNELERLCLKAKELDIPLEFNMLGYLHNRHYPSAPYLKMVRDIGNKMIVGCDAHEASAIDANKMRIVIERLKKEGFILTDEISFLRQGFFFKHGIMKT